MRSARPAGAGERTARTIVGPSPPVLLVANGNSSGVDGRRLAEEARELLRGVGGRVDLRRTESVEEFQAVLRGEGCGRRIVLLGGDGTLHAAANLDSPGPQELALLPAGRANNVARSLGIPTDLRAAAELAVSGRARAIDVVVAQSTLHRYITLEAASIGFHALARTRFQSQNSAAAVPALRSGLAALARFRPLRLTVESDGGAETMTVGQLFLANMPRYAFGLRVAPLADPCDGLLDIVAIEARDRRSVVSMLARLRLGTHVGRPGVRMWRSRRVRLNTDWRSPVVCDATDLGHGPVELAVEPAALHVVAPRAD